MACGRTGAACVLVRSGAPVRRRTASRHRRRRRRAGERRTRARGWRRLVCRNDPRQRIDAQHQDGRRVHRVAHASGHPVRPRGCEGRRSGRNRLRRPERDAGVRGALRPHGHQAHRRRARVRRPPVAPSRPGRCGVAPGTASRAGREHAEPVSRAAGCTSGGGGCVDGYSGASFRACAHGRHRARRGRSAGPFSRAFRGGSGRRVRRRRLAGDAALDARTGVAGFVCTRARGHADAATRFAVPPGIAAGRRGRPARGCPERLSAAGTARRRRLAGRDRGEASASAHAARAPEESGPIASAQFVVDLGGPR